jgi:uncharacterized membrane protein YidH (DUF202 family)
VDGRARRALVVRAPDFTFTDLTRGRNQMASTAAERREALVRPNRLPELPVPPIPNVDESKSDVASVQYSAYRTSLSNHRIGLSEHRTSLSEYRTDLSTERTEMSMRRTGMSFQRTRLSADRTLMSVIRTSLSLIGFGFSLGERIRRSDVGISELTSPGDRRHGDTCKKKNRSQPRWARRSSQDGSWRGKEAEHPGHLGR